jgi:FixJ family two-component response regulator
MTPFRDQPDKFQWKWTNVEKPKPTGTLPADLRKDLSTLPVVILSAKQGDNAMLMSLIEKGAIHFLLRPIA